MIELVIQCGFNPPRMNSGEFDLHDTFNFISNLYKCVHVRMYGTRMEMIIENNKILCESVRPFNNIDIQF